MSKETAVQGVRHRITVAMNAEMVKDLKQQAVTNGKTVSELIREALQDYLKP